jgi:hypothetical protein
MNLEGRCACGNIRYRLTAAPMIVHACHCRDCQRLSGSAFAINLWIERKFVEASGGEPVPFPVPMSSPAANAARVYGINTMRHPAIRSCCAPARLMMQQRYRPTCISSPAAKSRGSSCQRERGRLRHSTRSTKSGRRRASPARASSPQPKLRALPMIRV